MSQLQLLDVDINRDERREHDFYETPAWMTRALLKRIPITGTVLEPCAGRGAISKVLVGSGNVLSVVNNEPHPPAFNVPGWRRLDATQPESWLKFPRVDWVVSNFPFDAASAIVPLAFGHARLGVAVILRLSWLEPTDDRAAFIAAHPPALINLPRHDWRGDGKTDSVTSAWFVFLCDEGVRRFGHFRNSIVTKAERDELIASELIA